MSLISHRGGLADDVRDRRAGLVGLKSPVRRSAKLSGVPQGGSHDPVCGSIARSKLCEFALRAPC